MSFFKINKATLICAFLSLIASCKNQPPEDNTVTDTEDHSVNYSILGSDSLIQLQFNNYKLNKDSFILLLNGKKISYSNLSDHTLSISRDSISAGNNILDFIYQYGKRSDTISKTYLNTLQLQYDIVNTYPHNSHYFTQGLLFDQQDNLIESTGLTGQSKILFYRKSNSGFTPIDSIINLENEFGEGITLLNGQIIQLLWKNMYLRIYDQKSHKHIHNLDYNKEGWGICTDGTAIYTSDGTGNIYKIDIGGNPVNTMQTITIRDDQGVIANINELEWINGYIFANIWQTALIYVIDPTSGSVIGKLDFMPLFLKEDAMNQGNIDVLNGIAYNPKKQTLLITGKNWSHFYEIKLKKPLSVPSK